MENVLTLIAPVGGLDETILASVAKALKVVGGDGGAADWLSPGEACDIPFSGANDAPMIRAAGMGVAYRGKPVAREAARARIEACGLTAALYMQGYRRDEFAG